MSQNGPKHVSEYTKTIMGKLNQNTGEAEMIDFTKPVRTKSGEPVEIITTEGRGPCPVIGYVGERYVVYQWFLDGRFSVKQTETLVDLENIPQKRSGWTVVRKGYLGHRSLESEAIYPTKEQAEADAAARVCSHVPAYIEWEE